MKQLKPVMPTMSWMDSTTVVVAKARCLSFAIHGYLPSAVGIGEVV